MKKLSIIILLILVAFGQMAWAQKEGISYIERSWDAVNKVVTSTTQTCSTYTTLTGNSTETIGLTSGQWYVVSGNRTCPLASGSSAGT